MTNRVRSAFVLPMFLALVAVSAGALVAQSSWRVVQGATSPGGVVLPPPVGPSTLLTESGDLTEESILALNDNYAAIVSPGDAGLLKVIDQDDQKEWIRLGGGVGQENGLSFPSTGSALDRSIRVHDEATLRLRSNGVMLFTSDENDGVGGFVGDFLWQRGTSPTTLLEMILGGPGDLYIAGAYKTIGSATATTFIRGEPLEHGDPVCLDVSRAGTVVRADRCSAVLGVVVERPGLALGGSILSPEALVDEWGPEILARFLDRKAEIESDLLSESPELREQAERLTTPAAFVGSERIKEEDAEGVDLRYKEALRAFEQRLDLAALQRFTAETFVAVAIAGRAEVKISPAAAGLAIGDSLSIAPGSELAVRGNSPGRSIGIALEPPSSAKATVKVLLQLGAAGGSDARERLAQRQATERLTALELRLDELLKERQELRTRLTTLEAARPFENPSRSSSSTRAKRSR